MPHPITGVTTLTVAGETRTLACDMNAAAAFFEAKGEHWSGWLAERFVGVEAPGGRKITALSPADLALTLFALTATDRDDNPKPDETVKSLSRSLGVGEYADVQLACTRCVLTAFGLPGKLVDDVVSAVDASLVSKPARGTGKRS